jgi:uridine kinase
MVLIAIDGMLLTGKSYLANEIQKRANVTLIPMSIFEIKLSHYAAKGGGMIKNSYDWDNLSNCLEALKNGEKYEMLSHDGLQTFLPNNCIILYGTNSTTNPHIIPFIDVKIYMEAAPHLLMSRFCNRWGMNEANMDLFHVIYERQSLLEKIKYHADIIIMNEFERKKKLNVIIDIIISYIHV